MAEVKALFYIGATFPALPKEIINQLALPTNGEHPAETAEEAGKVELVANAIIKIDARALTAIKLGLKVGHVEAGLRSYDWRMPKNITAE